MNAKEIIVRIKNNIGFQRADDEECAHYSMIGGNLVRIATSPMKSKNLGKLFRLYPDFNGEICSLVFSESKLLPSPNIKEDIFSFEGLEKLTEEDVNKIIEMIRNYGKNE